MTTAAPANDLNAIPSPDPAGFFSQPPGWPVHLASVVTMVGFLDTFSAPGGFIMSGGVDFLLLSLLLCAIWIVRAVIFTIINRTRKRLGRSLKIGWRRWITVPLIVLLTFSLIAFDVPVRLRFRVSRNAMTLLAQQAAAKGPLPMAPNWAGSPIHRAGAFNVTIMQVTPAGDVYFRVPGTEFFRSFGGFAYCPSGNPSDSEGSFQSLGGSWYSWNTSW
jgi:hypothetical protein